jgi:putative phosphoribosyl transferase
VFADRVDAGTQLARKLAGTVPAPAVVLGIARGGVIVGAEIARELGVPLDVVICRKLGAPGNPELGIGAVAPGVRVIDEPIVRALGVDDGYLERETSRQIAEIARRMEAYRAGREPVAALRWARAQGAATVVFAAPVGPAGIERRLEGECDRCVVSVTPTHLRAVGQWYERFDQTTDDEVRVALRQAG